MSDSEELPAKGLDIERYLRLFLAHIWVIGGAATIGAVLAGIYASALPRLYDSKATMLVETRERDVVGLSGGTGDMLQSQDVLNTVVDMLRSRALLERVASEPSFTGEAVKNYKNAEDVYTILYNQTGAYLRPGTRLVDISVESQNAYLARDLAAAIYEQFIETAVDQRTEAAVKASRYLVQEEEKLRQRLEDSESKLQEYRESFSASFLEERESVVLQQLREISSGSTSATNERLQLESDLLLLDEIGTDDPDRISEVASVAEMQAVVEAKRQLSDAEANFAVLKQRYGELHPKYIEAKSRLDELARLLDATVADAKTLLTRRLETARERENLFKAQLDEREKSMLEMQRVSIPFRTLSRQVESDRSLYEAVVNSLNQSLISPTAISIPYRLVDSPVAATYSLKPDRKKIVMGGFMAGFLLSCGFVLLRDTMDPTIKSVAELQNPIGLPVLAEIPMGRGTTPYILSLADPVSEAFRTLRASLVRVDNTEGRSFLFTSPTALEAAAFDAVNVAAAFARQGFRTLLIDADLRSPSLHQAFDSDVRDFGRSKGLAEWLLGEADYVGLAHATSEARLSFISAGQSGGPALELLGSPRMLWLLHQSSEDFDRVVLLTAPMKGISDASILAPLTDAACLVVEVGRSKKEDVVRSAASLQKLALHFSGAVVNYASPQSIWKKIQKRLPNQPA